MANRQNFNDKTGDIPKSVPKQAREISAFFSLLTEETMKKMPSELTPTWIRCFRKGCTGTISSAVDLDENKLFWKCSECKYSGTLIGFQGYIWNNSKSFQISNSDKMVIKNKKVTDNQ